MSFLSNISPGTAPGPRGADWSDGESETSLAEAVSNFWEGRYIMVGSMLAVLLLGAYYSWRKSPVYQVDALLQVEDKKTGKGGAALAALEGLFEQPTVAQAEIEIIKSNLVLGRTVEALSLDILAHPYYNLMTGDALVRGRANAPSLRLELFELPTHLRGASFWIISQDQGVFRWEDASGKLLALGREGEDLAVIWQGQPLRLKVRHINGSTGQRFVLGRLPILKAIEDLRHDLRVAERGKQTNILGLSFDHRSPIRGAEILNEIIGQYVHQNIERKAEEASKTLAFLQEQMPQLRGKLEVAENQLNQFRMQSGSVDLPEEVKLLLKQSVDFEGQALLLKQKKEELLRTYKEGADVVSTLNQQLAKLDQEAHQIDDKVRLLPHTQQEFVRLAREVQVNTDLYTALLNNVQQLQVAKAGEIGNARIVDHAMASLQPIRPKKAVVMALAAAFGLFLGTGLVLLRRALYQGVEDPRIIENRLGLSVVVTIPHSEQQSIIQKAGVRKEGGFSLLAQAFPEDLAIESLRSLRTSLHFTMMDASNRVIMVVGPSPSIGKSFVTSNFAAVLAQAGQRVLVVDGDLRRGRLHEYFGLSGREGGLSEVLVGDRPWSEVVQTTSVPGLEVITTGTVPPNPSELLMSSRFPQFVQEVSHAYDLVLMDAPPVLAVTDASIIGTQVGTVLLLAKAKAHPLGELLITLQRLESSGIRPKGCIFNDVKTRTGGYGSYQYNYHYAYQRAGKD